MAEIEGVLQGLDCDDLEPDVDNLEEGADEDDEDNGEPEEEPEADNDVDTEEFLV